MVKVASSISPEVERRSEVKSEQLKVKNPLLGYTLKELGSVATEIGMPRFGAKQLAQWLYEKNVSSIDEMTNISKAVRERLKERYEVGVHEPIERMTSVDGTEKYLFPTLSGHFIETVYIPDGERGTLCVSTQVGCKMNCLFCQTGKQGFQGNLETADILSQVSWAHREKGLTNLVFMGQGEPFDNLDNVMKALEILTADYGFAWSPKRITVSSVGLKKNLRRYLEESQCHLAISLHSPIHEQRLQLMPAERQFAIAEVVEMLKEYDFSHQRRLSFEYIVFKGVNDSEVHAKELLKLLRGLDCRVNLIRFHQIPNVDLQGTDDASMMAFRDYLTKHGLFTTVRTSRGQDIFAACGLLSTKVENERPHPQPLSEGRGE